MIESHSDERCLLYCRWRVAQRRALWLRALVLTVDAVHDGRRAPSPTAARSDLEMALCDSAMVIDVISKETQVRALPLGQRARARAAARAAAAAAAPAGAPHVRAALLGAGVAFMLSVSLDTRLDPRFWLANPPHIGPAEKRFWLANATRGRAKLSSTLIGATVEVTVQYQFTNSFSWL